jgi:hypothetical protein
MEQESPLSVTRGLRLAEVERAALQNNEHLVKLMMDHYALGFSLRVIQIATRHMRIENEM